METLDPAAVDGSALPRLRPSPPSDPVVPPQILLIHSNDLRLLALLAALAEAEYRVLSAADAADARTQIGARGMPDVLLLGPGCPPARSGMGFARECLAACAAVRVIYLTPLPWPDGLPLLARERWLRIPFTEPALVAALAAGWPVTASASA